MGITGLYFFVGALCQGLADIFMAGAAGFRTDECRFGCRFGCRRRWGSLLFGAQQYRRGHHQ
jgi:hypothetical protein